MPCGNTLGADGKAYLHRWVEKCCLFVQQILPVGVEIERCRKLRTVRWHRLVGEPELNGSDISLAQP